MTVVVAVLVGSNHTPIARRPGRIVSLVPGRPPCKPSGQCRPASKPGLASPSP